MNAYGERPNGRARVPGSGPDAHDPYSSHDPYRSYPDAYADESYGADPYPADPYQSQPARAPVAAAVGRATATAAVPTSPSGHRYDWSGSSRTGRATVPVSPGPGGPAVGRASVRPPGGPGGPTGPGDGRPARRKKRHWLRNSLLSALAVGVMLAGGGMVALSYYVDEVEPPERLALSQASRIVFADGEEMTILQEENRELIDTTGLTIVQDAVIAAEDQKFWEHSGVDFLGIARAAWNNFRGGPIQGASTITQQYARAAGDLHGRTYERKLKEAAMAYKLSQQYDRREILDFYLNTVYFGRGAHGIEAAAKAYFGVAAAELDVAQAAMLAGIIRLPDDGSGLSRYDPLNNPEDPTEAVARWRWVIEQMVGMNSKSLEGIDPAGLELPEVIEPSPIEPWHEGPQGPIVRQMLWELEEMGITDISTGGYRITTTIDPEMQEAALRAADREQGGPLWEGGGGYRTPEENVGAALVSIDPQTGAVRAYYGGDDGTAYDLAGRNWSEEQGWWYGGRPPGSSFKIYSVLALLREGVSLDSHWKAGDYTTPSGQVIRNAGRTPEGSGCSDPDYCTMRWAVEQSFNVPFYHFSEAVPGTQGPALIVQAAKDAGVTMITDNDLVPHDLTATEATEVAPEYFFHHVAFGQYPVTVLDHASGVATLAARGVYHKPHFVERVERRSGETGEWDVIAGDRIAGEERIAPQHVDALTDVLSRVPGLTGVPLANGRVAAAKTGTWEYTPTDGSDPLRGNADAWMVGYTPQVATAVWVGVPERPVPIKYTNGENIGSSALPSHIWRQFMDEAHAAKELPLEYFTPARPIGDTQHPYANGEEPKPDKDERRCRPRFLCEPGDDDGDDDDDEDDPGEEEDDPGDGGGGGIPIPIPDPGG
jgi:membrane peptidoglycan carboxypeptidase